MVMELIDLSKNLPFDPEVESAGLTHMTLLWLPTAGTGVPGWWSPARDKHLSTLWRKHDPFKIAVNTFINKAVTIPFSIKPRDRSVRKHTKQAAEIEYLMRNASGMLRGWKETQKKLILSYLTQDNGTFAYVMGRGPSSKPLLSGAVGIFHLESQRCQRTGDPEIPVLYTHTDGQSYEMHRSRVIYFSNLPDEQADMLGVGHCAITCALDSAQELGDITQHSREKFGSRPQRQILYAKKGATIDQLSGAIRHAEQKLTNDGLALFSKTTLLAPKTATGELEMDKIDLTSAPDGFDRQQVSMLDFAIVAAAFGLDLHDLALSLGVSGQTRANAEVQARKGRGKGVGEYLETFIEHAERTLLPPHLKFVIDNADDDQDEQQANVWNIRSVARQRDLQAGTTTVRAERIRMVENDEISEELYEDMELEDGRLPDGSDVTMLFYTKDELIAPLLVIPDLAQPLEIETNDASAAIMSITKQMGTVYNFMEEAPNANYMRKGRFAMAALTILKGQYEAAAMILAQEAKLEAEQNPEEEDPKVEDGAPQTNQKTPTTPQKTNPKMSRRRVGVDRNER